MGNRNITGQGNYKFKNNQRYKDLHSKNAVMATNLSNYRLDNADEKSKDLMRVLVSKIDNLICSDGEIICPVCNKKHHNSARECNDFKNGRCYRCCGYNHSRCTGVNINKKGNNFICYSCGLIGCNPQKNCKTEMVRKKAIIMVRKDIEAKHKGAGNDKVNQLLKQMLNEMNVHQWLRLLIQATN